MDSISLRKLYCLDKGPFITFIQWMYICWYSFWYMSHILQNLLNLKWICLCWSTFYIHGFSEIRAKNTSTSSRYFEMLTCFCNSIKSANTIKQTNPTCNLLVILTDVFPPKWLHFLDDDAIQKWILRTEGRTYTLTIN